MFVYSVVMGKVQIHISDGEAFLSRIVTGDNTWIFHDTPDSKAELMTWKHPHSPAKEKLKRV
jgi:hypothetical protein